MMFDESFDSSGGRWNRTALYLATLLLAACSSPPSGSGSAATASGNSPSATRPLAPVGAPTPSSAVNAAALPAPMAAERTETAIAVSSDIPPLPRTAYSGIRPLNVMRDVHTFAAQHPEVLDYVPCFCGCENAGHRGNADCFVRSRNSQGEVTGWEEHGGT